MASEAAEDRPEGQNEQKVLDSKIPHATVAGVPAEGGVKLNELPMHLLLEWLSGESLLSAEDLCSLECTAYAFRGPTGLLPLRFMSLVELAALQRCQQLRLFRLLSPVQRQALLRATRGCWKRALRMLQAMQRHLPGEGGEAAATAHLSAGAYSTHFVNSQGELLMFGQSQRVAEAAAAQRAQAPSLADGQSSGPGLSQSPKKTPIPEGAPVCQVSGHYGHVALVLKGGQVLSFGANKDGQAGHPLSTPNIAEPTAVPALEGRPCKQVATGQAHTLFLTEDGKVLTCGRGDAGQLGRTVEGQVADQEPAVVTVLADAGRVMHVSAGKLHSLAVTEAGVLFSWGAGGSGQLGARRGDGERGVPQPVEALVRAGAFIVMADAGETHSVALDVCGRVYTFGSGHCGALGSGNEVDCFEPQVPRGLSDVLVVQVAARKRRTFAVTASGAVFAFGHGLEHCLGFGDTSTKVLVPRQLPTLESTRIVTIWCGWYHTIAATKKGEYFGFGDNSASQLGLTTSEVSTPSLLPMQA